MFRLSAKAVLLAAISASVGVMSAATPAIGVATSAGNIRINDSNTAGNATIFNGTTLETEGAMTRVHMKDGARLEFTSASQAKLFSDHIDLQRGSARITGVSANAKGLRILPGIHSSVNVALVGDVVQVAAVTGSARVLNAQGFPVANLFPGRALNLTPQDQGASAPSSMVGCVQRNGDVYTLTDETSNVTVQLRGGTNLRAGRRVQVTGTNVAGATAAGGATQVLSVTSVKDVGGSCSNAPGVAAAAGAAAGGAAAGAAGAAAAGAVGGISATTAIIAGVGAAAVAGTAAAVAATSSGSSGLPVGCAGVSPCTSR